MSSQPPPKQRSIASLFWDIIRLSARMMWGSRANPVRPILERQQALAMMGLPPTATRQQIKRRYRELAKKYHPDRGGDSREMQRLVAAYQLLMKDSPS
jgi:DnaJ-domain-containing protein 1